VFVVEVMGAYCGYLALNAALGAGAETVYLPEEGVTLDLLKENSLELVKRFAHKDKTMAGGMGLIIINERANKVYNTNFVASLFEEEGKGSFSVRKAVLGHLQQGGDPSPIDRIRYVHTHTHTHTHTP
jgi:6-phosphofructokinase 1